jgi:hypothetical protein
MKTINTFTLSTVIFFFLALAAWSQTKADAERNKFINAILAGAEAAKHDVLSDKMIELESQAIADAEKVNLSFLEWVEPGLSKAWTDYFIKGMTLHVSGMKKARLQTDEGTKQGVLEQYEGCALLDKWEKFYQPKKQAILAKLKITP